MLTGIFSTNRPFFSPLRTRRVRRVRRSLLALGGRGEDCGETSGEDGADLGIKRQHRWFIIVNALEPFPTAVLLTVFIYKYDSHHVINIRDVSLKFLYNAYK